MSKTVRRVLIHQGKYITSSGTPSIPMVASIGAVIGLLRNGKTKKVQSRSLISIEVN